MSACSGLREGGVPLCREGGGGRGGGDICFEGIGSHGSSGISAQLVGSYRDEIVISYCL